MRKNIFAGTMAVAIALTTLAGCGATGTAAPSSAAPASQAPAAQAPAAAADTAAAGDTAAAAGTWTVTCPWAPSGVAAMVNQKAAALSTSYSKDVILVADAIKGDAATVNSWVASTKANDPEMVFAGEGLFSITSILDPAKLQFGYDDFAYVENLYSSVFVLSADAKLGITSIPELEEYMKAGNNISVATNGATGSEAFLAAALFGSMDAGEQVKIVAYESAAEAAQAVAKGETDFAVSHQSQILETAQQGGAKIIAAFDADPIETGEFKGVEGVGKYGYPYFKNCCFILARQGTDEAKITALRTLYDGILNDAEMVEWLNNTMLLESNPMTEADVKAHIENVQNIVNEYKDLVIS